MNIIYLVNSLISIIWIINAWNMNLNVVCHSTFLIVKIFYKFNFCILFKIFFAFSLIWSIIMFMVFNQKHFSLNPTLAHSRWLSKRIWRNCNHMIPFAFWSSNLSAYNIHKGQKWIIHFHAFRILLKCFIFTENHLQIFDLLIWIFQWLSEFLFVKLHISIKWCMILDLQQSKFDIYYALVIWFLSLFNNTKFINAEADSYYFKICAN